MSKRSNRIGTLLLIFIMGLFLASVMVPYASFHAEGASVSVEFEDKEYDVNDPVSFVVYFNGLSKGNYGGKILVKYNGLTDMVFKNTAAEVEEYSAIGESSLECSSSFTVNDSGNVCFMIVDALVGYESSASIEISASFMDDFGNEINVLGSNYSLRIKEYQPIFSETPTMESETPSLPIPTETMNATVLPETLEPTPTVVPTVSATPVVTTAPTPVPTPTVSIVATSTPRPQATDKVVITPVVKPSETSTVLPSETPTAVVSESPSPEPTLTVIGSSEPSSSPVVPVNSDSSFTIVPSNIDEGKEVNNSKKKEDVNPISVGAVIFWSIVSLVAGIWIGIFIGSLIWRKKSIFMTPSEKKIIGRY